MDFSDLSDDDLWLQIQDDLYDGMKAEVTAETHEALGRGYSATDVLGKGLVAGMDIVGADFRDGILFVPEVLMAANAMKAGMEILRPLLTETGAHDLEITSRGLEEAFLALTGDDDTTGGNR